MLGRDVVLGFWGGCGLIAGRRRGAKRSNKGEGGLIADKACNSCLRSPFRHGTSYSLHHNKRGSPTTTGPIEENLR